MDLTRADFSRESLQDRRFEDDWLVGADLRIDLAQAVLLARARGAVLDPL